MSLPHLPYIPKKIMTNQRGATLVIVMLVLIAVTVLGLASINISTIEQNLAGNDKFQKTGFYNGDSGLHGTPAIISPVLNGEPLAPEGDPDDPNNQACLQYLGALTAANFPQFIKAQVGTNGCDPNQLAFKDISFRACNVNADIDICPTETRAVVGGAMEFAGGTLGVGGGGGSMGTYYRIVSTGDGDRNTTYTVSGHYRWVSESGGMR